MGGQGANVEAYSLAECFYDDFGYFGQGLCYNNNMTFIANLIQHRRIEVNAVPWIQHPNVS